MACACGGGTAAKHGAQSFVVTDKKGQQRTFTTLIEAKAFATRVNGALQPAKAA